jgi:hypothetical protein
MSDDENSDLSKDVSQEGSNKILQKKFNKLRHKALYVDAEYEEMCEVFSHAQSQFISNMFSYCHDKKIRPPLNDEEKKQKEKEKNETSEELKYLYREIVKATHPDKTKNLSDSEIEDRNQLYLDAVRGKQDGDYWGIFKAALELNVPIKNLSFKYLEELEQTIDSIEKKMKTMESDLMYRWFYSNDKTKENIFSQLTKDSEKYD